MKPHRTIGQWKHSFRLVLWLLVVTSGFFGVNAAKATAADVVPVPLEHKVKAACLFNFAANTEWPAQSFTNAEAPIVIGLVGDVPFAAVLERGVEGKKIQERAIKIAHIEIEDLQNCHVVFIAASKMSSPEIIAHAVGKKPVLIVGEGDDFAKHGGMINFVKVDGSVKFEVNLAAANRAGLKLGSQLLKLAIVVGDKKR